MTVFRACINSLKANWFWLRWVVAVGVLAFLFQRHQEDLAGLAERSLNWTAVSIAFALCGAALLTTFYRWYLLVSAQGMDFHYHDALRLGFLGYLFNYVAPGGAGGDLVKALLLAREYPKRKTAAVFTIFLDRILGMLGLFLIGTVVINIFATPITANTQFQVVKYSFWLGSIGGLIGLVVLLTPGLLKWKLLRKCEQLPLVGKIFAELFRGMELYQSRRSVLILSVLISLLGHAFMLSAFYFCALALFSPAVIPDYVSHLQFIPAAELVGVAVPLPGGIGALEEANAWFYELAGFTAGHGFLAILVYRVITILLATVGAGYYFTARREIDQVLEEVIHDDESLLDSFENSHPASPSEFAHAEGEQPSRAIQREVATVTKTP